MHTAATGSLSPVCGAQHCPFASQCCCKHHICNSSSLWALQQMQPRHAARKPWMQAQQHLPVCCQHACTGLRCAFAQVRTRFSGKVSWRRRAAAATCWPVPSPSSLQRRRKQMHMLQEYERHAKLALQSLQQWRRNDRLKKCTSSCCADCLDRQQITSLKCTLLAQQSLRQCSTKCNCGQALLEAVVALSAARLRSRVPTGYVQHSSCVEHALHESGIVWPPPLTCCIIASKASLCYIWCRRRKASRAI